MHHFATQALALYWSLKPGREVNGYIIRTRKGVAFAQTQLAYLIMVIESVTERV